MIWVLLIFLLVPPGDGPGVDTIAMIGYPTQDLCLHAAVRNNLEDDPTVEVWQCVTEADYQRLWKARTGQAPP